MHQCNIQHATYNLLRNRECYLLRTAVVLVTVTGHGALLRSCTVKSHVHIGANRHAVLFNADKSSAGA